MNRDEAKELIKEWAAVVWSGEVTATKRDQALAAIIVPDRLKSVAASWEAFHSVYRDARAVIEDQVAEGDRVATRLTVSATIAGHPTTFTAIYFHRIESGRIAEAWSLRDAPQHFAFGRGALAQ